MFGTAFIYLALALSIFHIPFAVAVAGVDDAPALEPRQSPNANAALLPACKEYAMVANLSTIGLNATYRAAFLRSSPLGTDAASSILDTQSPRLAAMMADAALNEQCGNLAIVAAEGAAANFSAGTVAGMEIKEAPGIEPASPVMPILVVIIVMILGGTFMSL
ncbi:hypothetical protein DL769_002676 [Monosporascus sp. CRB-8-3]|nr:hypothetical protein DL769_002676 [Monosporascus sp. CRB-8-3]